MFMFVLLVTCLSSINAAHFKVITGRSEIWSDEDGNQGGNGKPTECLEQSRTNGDESNNYGDDIGTQCCRVVDDAVQIGRYFTSDEAAGHPECVIQGAGSTGEKLCCRGVDYDTAKTLCESRGDRLCTFDEAKDATIQTTRFDGSGCDFDAHHVWTSTGCGGHMAVTGRSTYESRGTDINKPDSCVPDDDTHGPVSNEWGDFMGTQCCQDMDDNSVQIGRFFAPREDDEEPLPDECTYGDDNFGSTADKLCCYGVDYCTAKNLCESEGYRLCTETEAEADLPRFDSSGCSFDAYHIWTSDLCGDNTEPSCGTTDCSAVDIDGYLTRCSQVFDRSLPQQISDLQDELLRVESEYQAADTQLGIDLRGEFSAADNQVKIDLRSEFEEADQSIRDDLTDAYQTADNDLQSALTGAFEAADGELRTDFEEADQSVRDDLTTAYQTGDNNLRTELTESFEAADNVLRTELSNDINTLQTDIEARLAAIDAQLALIADIGGAASTSPLIDFSNNNHILLFSLFINIIVIILGCCMYIKYKAYNTKNYGKVASFVDSDSENQQLT